MRFVELQVRCKAFLPSPVPSLIPQTFACGVAKVTVSQAQIKRVKVFWFSSPALGVQA